MRETRWDDWVSVRAADATVVRAVTVRPGMCGANGLLVGQLGDWTWESVGLLCGLNPFTAVTPAGQPAYLSFFYYEVIGNAGFHLHSPTFGERLQVVSRCFDYGPQSVLTVHRLSRENAGEPAEIGLDEPFAGRHDNCLYVQNFNRWVQRGGVTNDTLALTSPVGFNHPALPSLPARRSPRRAYDSARRAGRFALDHPGAREAGTWVIERFIDPARDINGAGLLYFAAYFALIDSGLAEVWRDLGRTPREFLDRKAIRTRVCLLGNAEAGSGLQLCYRRSQAREGERFDVGMRVAPGHRTIAIAALDFPSEPTTGGQS
jgi:probable biosynthetic protein (TIGR04098 family)